MPVTPPSSSPPQSSPLGPPQFGLRTLLLVTSSLAVLLGLMQWVSPITLAFIVFLLLSIIAHVAANAIGTRLREGRRRAEVHLEPDRPEKVALREDHFAPVSKLGGRHSLGPILLIAAISGFLVGAVAGTIWTASLLGSYDDPYTLAIAAVAFGALGGFGAFLVVGFCKSGWDAWQEASNHSAEPPEKKSPTSNDPIE